MHFGAVNARGAPMSLRVLVELNSSSSALDIGARALAPLEQQFSKVRFEYLPSHEQLPTRLPDADVVLCWRFPRTYYPLAPRLRAVITPAAGRDWVEDDPSGRVVTHHCSFHGALITESMLAAMLHFNDRRTCTDRCQAAHEWGRDVQMPRRLLASQHVLLVGYGAIARHCARLLHSLGTRVTGTSRTPPAGLDPDTTARIAAFSGLHALLAEADHVVLLLPGGAETRHLIGEAELAAMKPGAYLYNYGRGTVLDEQALVKALHTGTPAGAALDVFESEPLDAASALWDLPSVLITPHSSCHYEEYAVLFRDEAAGVLRRLLGTAAT